MSIKARPLVVAAAIGAALQIVLSLVNTLSTYLTTSGIGAARDLWIRGAASALGSVVCLCALALDVGVGLLYAYLHSREAAVSAGDGALGGAASGAICRLGSGLVGVLISLLFAPVLVSRVTPGLFQGDIPSDFGGVMLGVGLAGGVFGAMMGICMAMVIGGVLGALGGVMGGAIFKPKEAPPATRP